MCVQPSTCWCGAGIAVRSAMNFATAVDRVRVDFTDMPGMELTMPQAVRLWGMGVDDCRFVVDALVDAGFLRWTSKWTIVRTGQSLDARTGDPQASHVPVYAVVKRDRSV
jgi:hypothetical protein